MSTNDEEVCLKVRLTEGEKAKMEHDAALCGLTQAEYVRQISLGQPPRRKQPPEFWELLDALYEVHDKLERLADYCNEWYAKNTSDKVRRVMQSRGNAGIPLTTSAPYGYKKAPEDKNKWIVDEPAAEVVRQIFQLSISGLGPTQIAKKLRAEGVMTPSEYFPGRIGKCFLTPTPHH